MAFGFKQYQRASHEVASPRETEAQAFTMVNRRLTEAGDDFARIRALNRNHQLWSLLLKDIALSSNGLPEEVKQQIASLGLWAMRYSTLAIARSLPIAPLVAVNQNMIDGLSTRPSAPPQRAPERISGTV